MKEKDDEEKGIWEEEGFVDWFLTTLFAVGIGILLGQVISDLIKWFFY